MSEQPNRTATAVQIELYQRLRGIAFGDVDGALFSLRQAFKTRQLLSIAMLKGDPAIWSDTLEYVENEIKKALFL